MTRTAKIPKIDAWEKQVGSVHWAIGKSAWAVANSWIRANDVPIEICNVLGNDVSLIRLEPEAAVALPGFRGPSQCDVFARVDVNGYEYILVIEAKFEEGFGKNVSKWYEDRESNDSAKNREYRFMKICEKLGIRDRYDEFGDLLDKFGHLPYQLFNESFAALKSAEFWDAHGAIMLVQSFCPEATGGSDFVKFCEVFRKTYKLPNGVNGDFDSAEEMASVGEKNTLYRVSTPSEVPFYLGWVECDMPEDE